MYGQVQSNFFFFLTPVHKILLHFITPGWIRFSVRREMYWVRGNIYFNMFVFEALSKKCFFYFILNRKLNLDKSVFNHFFIYLLFLFQGSKTFVFGLPPPGTHYDHTVEQSDNKKRKERRFKSWPQRWYLSRHKKTQINSHGKKRFPRLCVTYALNAENKFNITTVTDTDRHWRWHLNSVRYENCRLEYFILLYITLYCIYCR